MLLLLAYIPNYFNLTFPLILLLLSEGRIDIMSKYVRFFIVYPSLLIPFSWLVFIIIIVLTRTCNKLVSEITQDLPTITDKEIKESLQ